jgi:polyphosphate kinase
MPRNFFNRVEVAVPIQDPAIKERIVKEILDTQLSDTAQAWEMGADGVYERVVPAEGKEPESSQVWFMEQVLDEARRRRNRARSQGELTIVRGIKNAGGGNAARGYLGPRNSIVREVPAPKPAVKAAVPAKAKVATKPRAKASARPKVAAPAAEPSVPKAATRRKKPVAPEMSPGA